MKPFLIGIAILLTMAALLTMAGVFVDPDEAGYRVNPEAARPREPRPMADLPTVRWVKPEDWGELAMQGGLPGKGWVLLPTESDGPQFQSAIHPESRGFFSAETCGECHQEIYQSFQMTGHAVTSRFPSDESILGSFEPGRNQLRTSDPDLWFEMSNAEGCFFQELRVARDGVDYAHKRSIDFVIGSGHHGQSYLYWEGDRLYQLHVSYLTELDQWVNSPGMYHDATADFSRPVPGRCLDCHATWFGEARDAVNRFDRRHAVPGVACVRCHGPGHNHVTFHRAHPDAETGQAIVNPSQLPDERINELCAQCHSGGEPIGPAFSYRPGQPLDGFLKMDFAADAPSNKDPHSANQLARLMKSRCFTEGSGLTCITCHDPHQQQRGQSHTFSLKCLKCHQEQDCEQPLAAGIDRRAHCVDCHMPSHRDEQVTVDLQRGTVSALIRDHYISIPTDVAPHFKGH